MSAAALIRSRDAVFTVFAVNGLALSSWLSRTPAIRDSLHLTPGGMSRVILALAVGALTALPLSGALTHRLGPRRTILVAVLATGLGLLGLVSATSTPLLMVSLWLTGLGSGTWDVAVNVEGAAVERLLGRSIMPRFHAAFSVGTMAGAGLGALAAQLQVSYRMHILVICAVAVASATAVLRSFLPQAVHEAAETEHPMDGEAPAATSEIGVAEVEAGEMDSADASQGEVEPVEVEPVEVEAVQAEAGDIEPDSSEPDSSEPDLSEPDLSDPSVESPEVAVLRSELDTPTPVRSPGTKRSLLHLADAWRDQRTLLIGLVMFSMCFAEGAANDWIALAAVDGYHVGHAEGALALGLFVSAMTFARTFGTLVIDRWGRTAVLQGSAGLVAVGVLAVVGGSTLIPLLGLVPAAILGALGAVAWGLGAALGFPIGISSASDDRFGAAARVGVVSTIGYTAFLAGPPILGAFADSVGIARSLLVVLAFVVLVIPASTATRPAVKVETRPMADVT